MPYKVAGTRETEIRSFKNPYPFRPLFPYYCQFDSSVINEINYDILPEETLTNYCEHTREFCVIDQVIDKTNIAIPTFLPTDSALWLDADDSSTLTLVSGAVSEWRDKSGNLRHATQGTAGNRPLLVADELNGTDVIRFNGNQWLNCTTNLTLTAQHLFIILKFNSSSPNFARIFSLSDAGADFNNSGHYIPLLRNGTTLQLCSFASSSVVASLSIANDEVCLWENSHSGSQILNHKNGRQQTSSAFSHTLNKTFTRYSISRGLGASGDISLGDISQIIMFPRVLTQAEREEMEGYLAWSTGLQGNLPVGHPYKNSYPGVTITEVTTCTDFYDFAQAP